VVAAQAQDALIPPPVPAPAAPVVYHLSLEEAKQRALASNQGLNLARLSLHEKSIAIAAAKKDYLPKILASVLYFHFNDNLGRVLTVPTGRFGVLPVGTLPVQVSVLNQDSSLGSITLAQPITKLIAVNAAVQLAGADAQIASAQLDKGTRDLLSGVAQAFYGLHGAQRIEAALTLQVNYAQQLARTDPKPEIRVAQIEAQQALLQVRSQAADIAEQLNSLLGFPAGTVLVLVEPLPPAAPVHSAEEAAHLALAYNPQVQEARANVEKAMAARKIAKMDFLPDINVFGSYFNQTAANYIQSNVGAIGVMGTYTLFDWGKRKQVMHQRETMVALAQGNVQATIDKVVLEARQSYLGYEKAREAYQLAADMVQARRDAAFGLKDPALLQAAKAATAKAELESMQAEIAYRIAHAQLMGIVGRG
jgi:outer membrane protein TolC